MVHDSDEYACVLLDQPLLKRFPDNFHKDIFSL